MVNHRPNRHMPIKIPSRLKECHLQTSIIYLKISQQDSLGLWAKKCMAKTVFCIYIKVGTVFFIQSFIKRVFFYFITINCKEYR